MANKKREPNIIGSLTWEVRETENSIGLPIGTEVVDDKTGAMKFEFRCKFQEDIYHLMQEPWRPKICWWSECGKYFIADKRAQKYCSTKCCGERKREQALDRYHRVEKARRQKSKSPRTRAHRKKS